MENGLVECENPWSRGRVKLEIFGTRATLEETARREVWVVKLRLRGQGVRRTPLSVRGIL
jgi:hypothetical protein